MRKRDTMGDQFSRYKGVIIVISIPVVLFLLISYVRVNTKPVDFPVEAAGAVEYVAVFDAGSSGSRIHILEFVTKAGQVEMQKDNFKQLKPGLSSWPDEPQKAAESLQPLLDFALGVIPKEQQAATTMQLRATAGLRKLGQESADKILDAVVAYLKNTPFKLVENGVTILDGIDEGAYAWLTLNYLLGNLGKGVDSTVAVIDMGGGSIQQAYAMEDEVAAKANSQYVKKLAALGKTYNVYVHSYLNYGLNAGRAKVMESAGQANKCLVKGVEGEYQDGDKKFTLNPADDASFGSCVEHVGLSMEVGKECGEEPQDQCSFNGAWGGPGGPGTKSHYVTSFFFDKALESAMIKSEPDQKMQTYKVKIQEYSSKATDVCQKDVATIEKEFEVDTEKAKFLCLDLSYAYAMLTKGFKLPDDMDVILAKQVEYKGEAVEAAWPIGAGLDSMGGQ